MPRLLASASIGIFCLLLTVCDGAAPVPPETRNMTGPGFTSYCIGQRCPGSRHARSTTPGVVLMGGSDSVDEAFAWQIARADRGNFLVFSASIPDEYNSYIWELSGGQLESVTTIMITERIGGMESFVVEAAESADAVFIAGGDQTLYVERITGTPLGDTLRARQSAITFSGTSAGCDFLSDSVFAPPTDAPSVTSPYALADPFAYGVAFGASPFRFPEFGRRGAGPAPAFLDDTHFFQRDRMGRLLVFGARLLHVRACVGRGDRRTIAHRLFSSAGRHGASGGVRAPRGHERRGGAACGAGLGCRTPRGKCC